MIRLSDPRPAFCSACHNHPDSRFVDFDADHDGGAFVDAETRAYIASTDDLHICEGCMRRGLEVLELKPELHARQLNEIRRLEIENESLRAHNVRLREALQAEPELGPVRRRPGRPRREPVA